MARDDVQEGKVRVSIWLPKGQHGKLKAISEVEGRSITDLIRQQVGDFLRPRFPDTEWTEKHIGRISPEKEG